MLRATLKSLLAHKLRMAMSAFAIVLGVAFVSGTLVFTDTTEQQPHRPIPADRAGRDRSPRAGRRGLGERFTGGDTRTVPAAVVATVARCQGWHGPTAS